MSVIKSHPMIIIKALMTRSAALIAAALAGVIDAISHSESFHKHSIGISGRFRILSFRRLRNRISNCYIFILIGTVVKRS